MLNIYIYGECIYIYICFVVHTYGTAYVPTARYCVHLFGTLSHSLLVGAWTNVGVTPNSNSEGNIINIIHAVIPTGYISQY